MKIPNAALAYREAASLGASPVGVVVLLYDRLTHDIHDAISAMKANDVETRASNINHALLILQQLQGKLDFTAGDAAARQLDAFYSHTRAKLLEAQIRQSPDLLLTQAQAITQVRESWAEVERATAQTAAAVPPVSDPSAAAATNLGA